MSHRSGRLRRAVPADGIPCEACRGFVDSRTRVALEEDPSSSAPASSEGRAEDKSRMFTANRGKTRNDKTLHQ